MQFSPFSDKGKAYYTFNENGLHEDYTMDSLGMLLRIIPFIANLENMSVRMYLSGLSDLILFYGV